MRAQWENEKKAITELKGTKEQIEEVKHQMEEAERNYDLEKISTAEIWRAARIREKSWKKKTQQ